MKLISREQFQAIARHLDGAETRESIRHRRKTAAIHAGRERLAAMLDALNAEEKNPKKVLDIKTAIGYNVKVGARKELPCVTS